MRSTTDRSHRELPRTDDLRHPARLMLHGLRPAFAAVARQRWDIVQRNSERVPAAGPVVLVANHIGFVDGPLMAIVGPRPVHALTKSELFAGPLGAFLVGAGQIPVTREQIDPRAIRTAIRVLRDGGVAGMFPERTRGDGEMRTAQRGAAYIAMATGATIVPLAFLGTRLAGSTSSFPPAGSPIVLTYGEPIPVEKQGWPRRQVDVRALTETLRQAIISTVQEAEQATGISLPGPIPSGANNEQNSQETP
ncbi:MAG: lysophospholipid acyltransferase family protein [Marmoricola sp.]